MELSRPATRPHAEAPAQNYTPAMAVISTVFFMWGFVTVLNDILVPHLKAIFELNYTQTMLIQFTFFLAYFLVSLPAAKIISGLFRTRRATRTSTSCATSKAPCLVRRSAR